MYVLAVVFEHAFLAAVDSAYGICCVTKVLYILPNCEIWLEDRVISMLIIKLQGKGIWPWAGDWCCCTHNTVENDQILMRIRIKHVGIPRHIGFPLALLSLMVIKSPVVLGFMRSMQYFLDFCWRILRWLMDHFRGDEDKLLRFDLFISDLIRIAVLITKRLQIRKPAFHFARTR